ncbi:MAG: hypothetical protein CO073_03695 [Candidatus Komeilibacteria bacterium CG_4_9_14_0_8_um_filter_36_9]|uniref:Fumarate lyase N-terminal domain-containing protein n=1 Tax=Candidatus Komeilibacteria bacterium CG_4_9_14_0_8_um_filter_36_9 TaxID=1974473 RepID=A0A2M8DQJ5_9BACT|nr:MAG: hypothetical protein CO073_03695 [Candidatus Komeilibacteria bacterium CG_4_9_14_0_8_um_filter_36_9]
MPKNLALPGNPRYQPKQLVDFFGHDNLYQTLIEVEIANLEVLMEIRVAPRIDASLWEQIKEELFQIITTEVDKREHEVTKHDIRALVQLMQEVISKYNPGLAQWVHIPLTSYDVVDTGRSLQFMRAYKFALQPSIMKVISIMADLAESVVEQLQIGRSHGKHALPITMGFWIATILNRITYNFIKMDSHASELVGKISGAVGAYNAQKGLGLMAKTGDVTYKEAVLDKLGLKAAPISTQILPPEPLAYFLFSCVMMSASFGQFGRDARHLMRSEIEEVVEQFEKDQVGSSTMAHKRNPINFENLEGTWLKLKNEFGKVLDTLISEHQRDLVGSSVYRDFPTILVDLQQQMNTLLRKNASGQEFLSRITLNEEAYQRNFAMSADYVLAEPLYIALVMAGYQQDAHHVVNHVLVPYAKEHNVSLVDALISCSVDNYDLAEAMKNIPSEVLELLQHPESYYGVAPAKTREIVLAARDVVAMRS